MTIETAEKILSTPVAHAWVIVFVLILVALVLILSCIDGERNNQGQWKRSQFKDDSEE